MYVQRTFHQNRRIRKTGAGARGSGGLRLIWHTGVGPGDGLCRAGEGPRQTALHRDARRGRGDPVCGRPERAGRGGGSVPCPRLCAAPHRGHGPRVRIPPSGRAGRPRRRAAAGRLRARRGPDPIHDAAGGFLREHPQPAPRRHTAPRRADRAFVRRRLYAARPGGRPGSVFDPRRHCGHLRARHEAARPHGVLGRRDRHDAHLRSGDPAPRRAD